ncbi:TPA: 50S ribosomal protein L21 [Candidatus Acetothermia bacterium]|nr:50S ribosomal protein L21 [Candidatus Acetothermia bacterium]HAZ30776.1 50S ribosomal protein L21 [Candidatus Acetothermia bacterium]
MYAVVEIGGKQYRVGTEDEIVHELIPGLNVGDKVTFDRVLFVRNGAGVEIGRPYLDSVQVVGEVLESGRGPKVIIQRFSPKKGYRRKKGHRQPYMRTRILTIEKG